MIQHSSRRDQAHGLLHDNCNNPYGCATCPQNIDSDVIGFVRILRHCIFPSKNHRGINALQKCVCSCVLICYVASSNRSSNLRSLRKPRFALQKPHWRLHQSVWQSAPQFFSRRFLWRCWWNTKPAGCPWCLVQGTVRPSCRYLGNSS